MSISFSGLASGLDTSSWVESLVALKKAKVTSLETEKTEMQSLQETLTKIKSFFSSFRSMLEKVTDTKLMPNSTVDLFAQNLATSSNLEALTASASTAAEEATYNVLVDKLATETKAKSNYSYVTTVVQTTTATGDSKLTSLGVKAGDITVINNGIEHGINITENDTLSTFIEKLKNIGVKADYNEKTGIFSVDISAGAIKEKDTNVVKALHLQNVNKGYMSNALHTEKTDTIFSAATEITKLSELGVKNGVVKFDANGKETPFTIDNNTTLGDLLQTLNNANIKAELSADGTFTIYDVTITDEGNTEFKKMLGLSDSTYSKSQVTGNLKHTTVTIETTGVTTGTKIADLGNGTKINDNDTVIVKNANNETTTITLKADSTLGDLLTGLTNAGLYAALNSDGAIEISGGTITGGTFEAEKVLGLEKEPYTAMVTGKPLSETVEEHRLVTLQTKLVDDLKVTEGYLEVTDTNGTKYYEKIYSGQTIADFMADMGNLGIKTSLDESTGVLTITGGAFKTLSEADVQNLVNNLTIPETDARYIKGTNLLQCLYGNDTIQTDQITVASTYAKSRALRQTVVNTIDATKDTTLGKLGLTDAGTAIFDVRGEQRTVSVTSDMTIEGLMTALNNQGIASSWDADHSRIHIENATLVGGTSKLNDALNLTTEISGKYVTTKELFVADTIKVDATKDTTLKEYGITNSMSDADRTVVLYKSDGTAVGNTIVNETTTVGDLMDFINSFDDISATLTDGYWCINNGYIENATLENSMGLTTNSKSSFALGSQMSVTTTAAVDRTTTLGSIIETLGTKNEVSSGYTLKFNDKTISVSATTTVDELINSIYANGGTASLDVTGRLRIDGGLLTGTVANALGIVSIVNTAAITATGETLYTTTQVKADRETKLSDLGITGETSYTVYNSLSQATTTVSLTSTATIGDFLDGLKTNGIDGIIADGVIKLDSAAGNYIQGALATSLGLNISTVTEVVNTTQMSTLQVTHTAMMNADLKTTIGDLGIAEPDNVFSIYDKNDNLLATYTIADSSTTIEGLFNTLKGYDIVGSINNGIISLYSPNGNYVTGTLAEKLGISTEAGENRTMTVGTTVTSTTPVTYITTVQVDFTTKIGDLSSYKIDGIITAGGVTGNIIGISSAQDLVNLAALSKTDSFSGKTFVLINDIDMSGITDWQMIGSKDSVFMGNFNGQGHTIRGLNMTLTDTNSGENDYGLFSHIGGNSTIKNLCLDSFVHNITRNSGDTVAGALAGRIEGVNVQNVSVTNFQATYNGGGAFVGGIVGAAVNSTISNSSTSGSISGNFTAYAAGIVASMQNNSAMTACSSSMSISSSNSLANCAGLIGAVALKNEGEEVTVTNCLATGALSTPTNVNGGLIAAVYTHNGDYKVNLNLNNCISTCTGARGLVRYNSPHNSNSDGTNTNTNINFTNCYGKSTTTNSLAPDGSGAKKNEINSFCGNFSNAELINFAKAANYNTNIWDLDNLAIKTAFSEPYSLVVSNYNTGETFLNTTLSATSTIQDVLDALKPYGNVSFSNGVLLFSGYDGAVVSGGLAELFGIKIETQVVSEPVGSTITSTAAVTYTNTVTANLTTKVSDVTPYKIDGTIKKTGIMPGGFVGGISNSVVVTGTVIAISTVDDLKLLQEAVNNGQDMSGKTFVLTNDIDMSGVTDWKGIGYDAPDGSVKYFRGNFDGQGHTISNLTSGTGIFGNIQDSDIRNLDVANVDVENGFSVIKAASNSTISNINTYNVTVNNGNSTGILNGVVDGYVTIKNCTTDTTVNATNDVFLVAGICGYAGGDATIDIIGCSSNLKASGKIEIASGVVGCQGFGANTFNIKNCKANVNVTSTTSTALSGIFSGYDNGDTDISTINIDHCIVEGTLKAEGSYVSGLSSGLFASSAKKIEINSDGFIAYNFEPFSAHGLDYSINPAYGTDGTGVDLRIFTLKRKDNYKATTADNLSRFLSNANFNTLLWNTDGTLKAYDENCIYVNNSDGSIIAKIDVAQDETLETLINKLSAYGSANLSSDGILTFNGTDGNYITGIPAESLGIQAVVSNTITVGATMTSTAAIRYTETTNVTATTNVNDLINSTLTIDGTITSIGVTGTVIGLSTAQDLLNLKKLTVDGYTMSGKTFVLTSDIDMSGVNWKAYTGKQWAANFYGTLDGQGHTISNLDLKDSTNDEEKSFSFFGSLIGATVKNLNFTNVHCYGDGTQNMSVLALHANNSRISNVNVDAVFTDCNGSGLIQGVAGSSSSTTIENCNINITYQNTASDQGIIGGLVQSGVSGSSTLNIFGCKVNIEAEGVIFLGGGLIGYQGMSGTINISNSAVIGTIMSNRTKVYDTSVSGFCGIYSGSTSPANQNATINIDHCYQGVYLGAYGGYVSDIAGGYNNGTNNMFNINATNVILNGNNSDSGSSAVKGEVCSGNSTTTPQLNTDVFTYNKTNVGYDAFNNEVASAYGFNSAIWGSDGTLNTLGSNAMLIMDSNNCIIGSITIAANDTVTTLVNKLSAYGTAEISDDGVLSFDGTNGNYIRGPLVDKLGFANTTASSKSTTIPVSYSTVTTTVTTTNVTIGQLDSSFTNGNIVLKDKNDNLATVSVTSTSTIADIFLAFANYGINGSINNSNGKMTLESTGDYYIESDNSNILKLFNLKEPYTTLKQVFTNTDSKKLEIEEANDMVNNTTLKDLGLTSVTLGAIRTGAELVYGADGKLDLETMTNNGDCIKQVFDENASMSDILIWMSENNISGSIADGLLYINQINTDDKSFLAVSESLGNIDFFQRLNLSTNQEDYIKDKISYIYSNSSSDELKENAIKTLKTSTTINEIGTTGDLTVSLSQDGKDITVTFKPDDTVDDILTTLAGYGISGQVADGKISLTGNKHTYITNISDDLKSLLKLDENDAYSSVITEGTTVNTDSNKQTYEDANAKITNDTVLSSIKDFNNGDGKLVVHQTNGVFFTISIDATKTLDDFFKQIGTYGLVGSVDTEGRVAITGVGNVYLQQVDGGSNILEALNMDSVVYNIKTVTVNRTSDTLTHTITQVASGKTTLENLSDKNGNSINFTDNSASLILETKSNAGDNFVTLNFSKTQSIYDVMETLSQYGINASIDSLGRFSVASSTLTDFSISGVLGEFLMGSYTKEYGANTTYNVTTNLLEKTIVYMNDSTKLSGFGVTSGDILVNQEGVYYTVNIDTTQIKTVGDFRNLLAQYGFNSNIDDLGRLNVYGVGNSSLANVENGSNILDVFGLTNWTMGDVTQQNGYLSQTQKVVRKVSTYDKLHELTDASGNNLGITNGQIYVYQDGTRSAINIDTNDTIETLAAKLSQYGISVGISQEGKLYFDGNNNSYLTTDGITTANASNILEKIDINNNWSTRYDSTSGNLSYTEENNETVLRNTKLVDLKDSSGNNLGITEGNFYIFQNGVRNTVSIDSNSTVNDLMATMAQYGLIADIDENGSIAVNGYNNTYMATSALADDNSNVVEKLFTEWNFVNIYTSNGLDIPQDVEHAITKNTKLANINVANGQDSYKEGYITVIKDGVKTNITLTSDDTVGTLMDELALYGFESVINDKGQLIIKNTGDSKLEAPSKGADADPKASNILDILGIENSNWINTNNYKSDSFKVEKTTTADASATRDTKLSELGVSTGEYNIYQNGVKYTAFISSDETLGSFMDTLKRFGIETSLVDGGANGSVLTIIGKGDSYVATSPSAGASNVVEKLFTGGLKTSSQYSGLEQTSVIATTTQAATESTLLSDLKNNGTALASSTGSLDVVVNGQKSTIHISVDETIGSLLDKFKALGLEATISNEGKILIQDGYDTMTIAATGTSKLLDNIGLKYEDDLGGYSASQSILNSTTSTIEERTLSVANYIDASTKLSDLNISDGTLSIYKDGQRETFSISSNNTFGDLRSTIAAKFNDIEFSYDDGYLKIYSKDGNKIEVGSTTDKGNFSAITGIANDGNGNAVSMRELYRVNGDTVLTSAGAFRRGTVTEGDFVVGNATFTITGTTTLDDIINQINNNESANASAYWDNVEGKFVIKSKTTGAALINIEAGISNFTDILGLTTTTTKDGNTTSRMNIDTQQLGDNAKVKINGTTFTSTSNTLGSDITRITGLKINLKGLTKDSEVTLKVERDKESLANAISSVVDSYNELMKNVDEAIASDGDLKNESTLKLIRNQLRNIMTSSIAGNGVYKNLNQIGIKTGTASGSNISTSNSAIVSLTFDKDAFIKAYEADHDAVRALVVGDATKEGVFANLENEVEGTLAAVHGYFAATENSYKQKINALDKKIIKANKEVERYKTRLEAKFNSMDMLIAQMQQQYSSFLKT